MISGYLFAPLTAVELRLTSSRGERSSLLPVRAGEKVAVGFEHSLYKVEQIETYGISAGGLGLESVFLGSFDALNYYDPLCQLPRRPSGAGYEVTFPVPEPHEVSFAIAHRTPVWLRVGRQPPLMLSDTEPEISRFSLRVSRVTRLQLFLTEQHT